SEFGDPRKRGFWASAAQIGVPVGNLMANGVLALVAALLTEDAFRDWGWRIGFLLSAVLVVFGLLIRLRLEETPVFQAIAERAE
ncbi:MFS transporter, partial [Mycobacterium kansasii]